MSSNILILGGTRFVGRRVLNLLEQYNSLNVFVASRRDTGLKNFTQIDRKEYKDLIKIFSKQKFDVIVDFINFSATDGEVLVSALKETKQEPRIISISTVYVYNDPNNLTENKVYKEGDFNPFQSEPINFTEWNYTKGKQSMEVYLANNYPSAKSTILRFPIILGEDDYTKRTYFFEDIIKNNKQIALAKSGGKANYIFSQEASEAIYFFITNYQPGIFNVSFEEALNEMSVMELYCEYYDKKLDDFLDNSLEEVHSPFFYENDFITNAEKFRSINTFENFNSFKSCLFRELKKME